MDKKFKKIDYDSMNKAIKLCSSLTEIIHYFGYNSKSNTIRINFRRKIKRLNLSISHYENVIFKRKSKERYNEENLRELVKKHDSFKDILYELDLLPITSNYRTLKKYLNQFNINYSKIVKNCKRNKKYSKKFIEKCVNESRYQKEAIRKIGLEDKGGNYKTFKKYIKEYNIDISHFHYKNEFNRNKTPIEEILVKNSSFNRSHLKRRLFEENLKQKRCEICGQKEEWNGKKLSFILDHKNGVGNDNRIENLRIICPNCDSTLNTYCGRNNKIEKKRNYCLDCKKEISKKSKRCKSCQGKRKTKVKRPSYKQLKKEIEETNFCAVGRKYGVSDNAVRKWIKNYEKEMNIASSSNG